MMVDSLAHGAGDAKWVERDSTRVNVESVLPRLPRNLDDMSLNLPRLQSLHRFLDRTKPSDERGLARHPRSRFGHLLSTTMTRVQRSKINTPGGHCTPYVRKGERATYCVFGDLTNIPRGQIFPASRLPQMRMPSGPIMSSDGNRLGILPG